MPTIHCLTVGEGDCTIIEHGSGRLSMVDICGGNLPRARSARASLAGDSNLKGSFRMCDSPTNPLDYLAANGFARIWRFISTHPDMDHLDGFDALMENVSVCNFWDHGARKQKPNFSGWRYREADWDRYVRVRDGKESQTTVVKALQASKFKYANSDDEAGNGDYLTICAPSRRLVEQCNEAQEFNDASYIIVYRCAGGRVVLAGDADDLAWKCAIEGYPELLRNVGFLLAPHHGRDSGRDRSFLSHLRPRLSLLGCAPSEYLAYDAWRNRNLAYYTQNQCGNVVVEGVKDGLEVYIQNEEFARRAGGNLAKRNRQGYVLLGLF